MPKIRFSGRVFPFVYDISMKDHPKVKWTDDELNLTMEFQIALKDGNFDVDVEMDRFDEKEHLVAVYMHSYDVIRTSIDLVAFNTGYGLVTLIESFTDASGVTKSFVPQDFPLAKLCTAFSSAPSKTVETNAFHSVLRIAINDWRISHSLRELIEAISIPHQATVSCARAIEGLRRLVTPEEDRKKAWPIFRDTLNISESYLSLITENSKKPRHGNRVRISGEVTTEIVHRSWAIMNRFLEFKKRDSQPLPESEFPLLLG